MHATALGAQIMHPFACKIMHQSASLRNKHQSDAQNTEKMVRTKRETETRTDIFFTVIRAQAHFLPLSEATDLGIVSMGAREKEIVDAHLQIRTSNR
jgi:hypothetical protein